MRTIKIKNQILIVLLGITTMVVYVILHEFGHVIPAKLFGANSLQFDLNIFSARYGYQAKSLSREQNSIVSIGGTLFPLALSFIAVIFSKKNSLFSLLSYLFILTCTMSLVSRIFPVGNSDTLNFIYQSGLSQLQVSAF